MANWKIAHNNISASLEVDKLRLVVHHWKDYPPDQWLASCSGLFEKIHLKSIELEDAMIEAESLMMNKVLKMANELKSLNPCLLCENNELHDSNNNSACILCTNCIRGQYCEDNFTKMRTVTEA